MRTLLTLVGVALAVTADVDTAAACEPMPCHPSSILPVGGTIPANASALRWYAATPLDPKDAAKMVSLTKEGVDVPFELKAVDDETFHVVPKRPFEEGASYTLQAKNACKYIGPKTHAATFSVGPAAAVPKTLGTLKLAAPGKGELKIGTASGSCDVDEPAVWADLEVQLSGEAAPWAALIDYEAAVDGKAWAYASTISFPPPPGQSEIGRGKARVYARCAAESYAFEGVGEGAHRVEMSGRVLGSSSTLKAEPLSVSLDCEAGASVPREGPAPHPTEDPRDEQAPSSPKATSDPAGAHAKGCNLGGGSVGALPLLLVFGRRRRTATRGRTAP